MRISKKLIQDHNLSDLTKTTFISLHYSVGGVKKSKVTLSNSTTLMNTQLPNISRCIKYLEKENYLLNREKIGKSQSFEFYIPKKEYIEVNNDIIEKMLSHSKYFILYLKGLIAEELFFHDGVDDYGFQFDRLEDAIRYCGLSPKEYYEVNDFIKNKNKKGDCNESIR